MNQNYYYFIQLFSLIEFYVSLFLFLKNAFYRILKNYSSIDDRLSYKAVSISCMIWIRDKIYIQIKHNEKQVVGSYWI